MQMRINPQKKIVFRGGAEGQKHQFVANVEVGQVRNTQMAVRVSSWAPTQEGRAKEVDQIVAAGATAVVHAAVKLFLSSVAAFVVGVMSAAGWNAARR